MNTNNVKGHFMYRDRINALISESGIFLSEKEVLELEMSDFGLNDFTRVGLTVHTYLNTDRCCAKELVLLPHQTCPEHRHPNKVTGLGKEETFRCRYGTVSVFISGKQTESPSVTPPDVGSNYYTVFKEVVLKQGEQLTLQPETKHWFQAHEGGAVVSEFSTHSDDMSDIFTDPNINRFSFIQ
ncbi:D-lyxose/D-mannose family sugar isomerase [Vibrio sp.]|nr:D-lyxose/D-mannose family sugar isomerase [Vibrio sp.]